MPEINILKHNWSITAAAMVFGAAKTSIFRMMESEDKRCMQIETGRFQLSCQRIM